MRYETAAGQRIWLEVVARLPRIQAALVAEELAAIDFRAFALIEDEQPTCTIQLYGADNILPEPVRALLTRHGAAVVDERSRAEDDILAGSFPEDPCELTDGVWLVPAADVTAPTSATTSIIVIPSPAFGDGRHPTTRMVADLLCAEGDLTGRRMLDIGCGSGVLTLLGCLRGAAACDGVDLDADSIALARANVDANGCGARCRIWRSDLLDAIPPAARYQLVVANLTSDLLLRVFADDTLRHVAGDAPLLVSGIGGVNRDEVCAAIAETTWTVAEERVDGWWHALRLVPGVPTGSRLH